MKIRYIIWALLLVLLGAAGEFALRNFTGLGPMPVRSAFAGRLPGIQEGNQRRFTLFYSTNRENSPESFDARGSVLSNKLSKGTFDVLVNPNLSIKPFSWFDDEQFKWGGRAELTYDNFKMKLKEAVQASPEKSLLVVVWGFRDWFQSAALKTGYTAYILDINTPVLLFDWPGNAGEGPQGYFAARQAAAESAPILGRLLEQVAKEAGVEKLWIMGSSLGCQTICDAMIWLTEQPDPPKLSHVVLSAPDVSAETFNDKLAHSIQTVSEHLTAYVSSNDRALLMSHFLNRGRKLGRSTVAIPPEDRIEPYQFEEGEQLLEMNSRHVEIVDATPINLQRNLHHFFTDSPEFFDDLYQRLLQPNDIVSRRLHKLKTNEGRDYWILWNN